MQARETQISAAQVSSIESRLAEVGSLKLLQDLRLGVSHARDSHQQVGIADIFLFVRVGSGLHLPSVRLD
jgi:hypothetical protein